jgi:choline dehydrogenase-like flavoprotein
MTRVVIVGSGPAAFFVTRALLQRHPSVKVLVLEAGPSGGASFEGNTLSTLGRSFKLDPTTYVGFGGTSELWHNVLAPLDPIDFAHRPWVPHSGWPIEYGDLDSHYKAVSSYFGIPYQVFFPQHLPADVQAEAEQVNFDRTVFQNKIFLQLQDYFRASRHFPALQQAYPGRLEIRFGALTQQLHLNRSSGGVEGVTYADVSGGCLVRVEADQVIVCAGGLRSARVLLNSGLTEALPWLGRGLMDHPMGVLYQFRTQARRHVQLYTDRRLEPAVKIKSALRLCEDRQREWSMPNTAFYLRPAFKEGPDNATEEAKLKLLTMRSRLLAGEWPLAESWALVSNANLIRQVIQYKTGLLSKVSLFDIMFVAEQWPGASQLELTAQPDAWGYPQLGHRWQLSDAELQCQDRFYGLIDEHLVRPFGGRMTFPLHDSNWNERHASAAHHLGACRMGTAASESVVDRNCQIHGLRGAYVCDGSVFPTAGNANPTFTIMALADRLGEHLAAIA